MSRAVEVLEASPHDGIDVAEMARIGGPVVVVGAVIGAICLAASAEPNERGEKFMTGALVGGIVGLLLGVGGIRRALIRSLTLMWARFMMTVLIDRHGETACPPH